MKSIMTCMCLTGVLFSETFNCGIYPKIYFRNSSHSDDYPKILSSGNLPLYGNT